MLILLIFIIGGLIEIGLIASIFIPYFRRKAYKDIEQKTLPSESEQKIPSQNSTKTNEPDVENSASKKTHNI